MLRFSVLMVLGLLSGLAQAQTTFDKMKGRGNIIVGYREDAAPFSFVDDSKKAVGYSLEFCEAIVARVLEQAGRAKRPVTYRPVPVDGIRVYVSEGTVDLLVTAASEATAPSTIHAHRSTTSWRVNSAREWYSTWRRRAGSQRVAVVETRGRAGGDGLSSDARSPIHHELARLATAREWDSS